MTITETKTAETTDWIGQARVLAADFATRAAEHDASDAFVAENYRALRAAKLFSAAVPTELGGGGATTPQICEVIRELGHGCGSTALAYSMHAPLIATTVRRYRHGNTPPAESLLRRVAAEELALVSSGGSDWLESSGTLTKKDGSFVYSGRKLFGSGSPSGDILLTTGVYNDPEKGEIILHFPLDLRGPGVRVLDNWRTLGMRGTGSNDIVIENIEVPAAATS